MKCECGKKVEYDSLSICIKCAEESYLDRRGLKFVEEEDRNFYLYFYGVKKVDRELREKLIDILEKEFLLSIDMDNDSNGYLKILKEYCLDDMFDWIKFLEKKGIY
jgi:homoserine acetyltransferase